MKKLKLGDVTVKSFVTNLKSEEKKEVKGGVTRAGCEPTNELACMTDPPWCYVSGSPCTWAWYCTAPK